MLIGIPLHNETLAMNPTQSVEMFVSFTRMSDNRQTDVSQRYMVLRVLLSFQFQILERQNRRIYLPALVSWIP